MRILMHVPENIRQESHGREELASRLFRLASDIYNECADDREAYLLRPDSPNPVSEQIELLDGHEDPEKLKQEASGWDMAIAAEFEKAIAKALASQRSDHACAARWLDVPTDAAYALKKTAMALDDDFYSFAEQAVLRKGDGHFTTRLYQEHLNQILADPGSYAAITVWPK